MKVHSRTLTSRMVDPEIITSPVANKVKRWEHAAATARARGKFDTADDRDNGQQRRYHASASNGEVGTITMHKSSQALRDSVRTAIADGRCTPSEQEPTNKQEVVIQHLHGDGESRHGRSGPTSHTIVHPSLSEDSASFPSYLKSNSEDDNQDLDWMRSQAQRIHKLNSVNVPQEIVGDYDKSHIVRTKLVADDEVKPPKKNFLGRIRRLVGPGKPKIYKNPALVEVQEKAKGTQRRKETPVSKKDTKLLIEPSPLITTSTKAASVPKDKIVQKTTASGLHPHYKTKVALQPVPASMAAKPSVKQSLNNELLAVFEKRRKVGSIHSGDVFVPTETPSETSVSRKNKQVSQPSRTMAVPIPIQQEAPEDTPPPSPPPTSTKATTLASTKATTIASTKETTTTAEDIVLASLQEYASNSIVEEEIPPKPVRENEVAVFDNTSNIQEETNGKSSVPSARGNPLTAWLTNKVDALANIGYEQSCSFLDWNGEETKIAMLEVVTKLTREDATARRPEGRKIPKLKLTKRVLTKEEVRARIMEEKRRRRHEENRNPGDDYNIVSQSRSDSTLSSTKEVKSLTLDSVPMAPPLVATKKKNVGKSSLSTFNKQEILSHAKKSAVKKDPPALKA